MKSVSGNCSFYQYIRVTMVNEDKLLTGIIYKKNVTCQYKVPGGYGFKKGTA